MVATTEMDWPGTQAGEDGIGDGSPVCVELLGRSALVRRTVDLVKRAAAEHGTVLVLAEAGLDAAAVARGIHTGSGRPDTSFLAVDCVTVGPAEAEEVLFGGASRAARRNGSGLERVSEKSALLRAAGGTLFLANVAELPSSAQVRLARVIRDGEVRVGRSGATTRLRARLIAAAAPTLSVDVDEGRFRADLYRRLARLQIELPPLRERAEDVAAMASHLIRELCVASSQPVRTFTQLALMLLSRLPWRGNVQELRALLDRVVASRPGPEIRLEDVLAHLRFDGALGPPPPHGSLKEARQRFEREYIAAILRQHEWRMSAAARALGIQRTNLYRKARQLGIVRPAGSGVNR